MSKRCEACEFWLYVYTTGDGRFGTCDHPIVEGKIVLDHETDEDIVIHTHEDFGCLYHTPLHGNVVSKLPGLD